MRVAFTLLLCSGILTDHVNIERLVNLLYRYYYISVVCQMLTLRHCAHVAGHALFFISHYSFYNPFIATLRVAAELYNPVLTARTL